MRRARFVSHSVAIVALECAAICAAQTDTPAQQSIDVAALNAEVGATMGLAKATVFTLDTSRAAAAFPLAVTFPLEGVPSTLELSPHSVRSESYEIRVQLADGSYETVEPGPVRTLRGTVAGIEGSVVAATQTPAGLTARIILPDGNNYWIEPVAAQVAGAVVGLHVVYLTDDIIPDGGTCVELLPPEGAVESQVQPGGVAGEGLFVAELAIDSDHEFFQQFAAEVDPIAAAEQHINDIVNAVNIQYERDASVRHVITTIILRSAEPDPYATDLTDAEALLFKVRSVWMTAGIQPDVTQLFTGKNLDGSVIGIAWVGQICSTSFGYSVVQSSCCSNFACKTDLSAHELGHNWSARHCFCPEWTMNPTLRCVNRFNEIRTIPSILEHRDSRTCLDRGDELRRVILTASADSVLEGDTLQFTAIADFRFGFDSDVTAEADWSVDRPEGGSIDSSGLLTAAVDVPVDTCLTVSGSFTFGPDTRTGIKTIVVRDTGAPLQIVDSNPPDGAIDARQPSGTESTFPAAGWQSFDLSFSGDTCLMAAADFDVTQLGGVLPAPAIIGLEHIGPNSIRLLLGDIIEPGAWTTLTHFETGLGIRVGYLPGDVNADGTAAPPDILAVIDAINGVGVARPIWSTDIDRSGQAGPPDILRVIDLLNGAGAYEPWNNRSLP